ncbi:MAG: transposase [Candidatus Hodarchaeota archaeon]
MDSSKVYCGRDGWATFITLMDAESREIVGCRFSCQGRAIEAIDAMAQHFIRIYSTLKAPQGLLLRSDNASVFLARDFIRTAKRLNITQEFIRKYSPKYNGGIERFFRTLKQDCVCLNRFQPFEDVESTISKWIEYCNEEGLHSSLGYLTPKEWRKQFYLPLAA